MQNSHSVWLMDSFPFHHYVLNSFASKLIGLNHHHHLVLAQASPIFHSSCEGKLGIALE